MNYEVWNNIIDDCKTMYEYEKEKRKNLEKEIERLKEYNESYKKELDFWRIQFSNKEDIIKEVREYIEEDIKGNYFKRYDDEVYKICDELLKILDKENNNV